MSLRRAVSKSGARREKLTRDCWNMPENTDLERLRLRGGNSGCEGGEEAWEAGDERKLIWVSLSSLSSSSMGNINKESSNQVKRKFQFHHPWRDKATAGVKWGQQTIIKFRCFKNIRQQRGETYLEIKINIKLWLIRKLKMWQKSLSGFKVLNLIFKTSWNYKVNDCPSWKKQIWILNIRVIFITLNQGNFKVKSS